MEGTISHLNLINGFSIWNSLNKNDIIIQDLRPYLVCDLLLGGYNAPASLKFVLLLTEVN